MQAFCRYSHRKTHYDCSTCRLGRKRKRGRRPLAAGAWEYQPFDIVTPPAHPLQDPDIIAGLVPPNLDVVAEAAAAVYDARDTSYLKKKCRHSNLKQF